MKIHPLPSPPFQRAEKAVLGHISTMLNTGDRVWLNWVPICYQDFAKIIQPGTIIHEWMNIVYHKDNILVG